MEHFPFYDLLHDIDSLKDIFKNIDHFFQGPVPYAWYQKKHFLRSTPLLPNVVIKKNKKMHILESITLNTYVFYCISALEQFCLCNLLKNIDV